MLTRIRFSGHREGSGRATSSTLTVPSKRKERRASDRGQKLLPPAVIAPYARKSLSEIVLCQISQRAVSDPTSGVNSVQQRRSLAPQWDSRPRRAKRQHHRCIGCEKTLLSFLGPSVGFSLGFIACVRACFRASLGHNVLRSECRPNTGRSAKQRRFACAICVGLLQMNRRKCAAISARAGNRCGTALQASLAFASFPMTGRSRP